MVSNNLNPELIKEEVIHSLLAQGYIIKNGLIQLPANATKECLRNINKLSVAYNVNKAEHALRKHEENLLEYIANGDELIPKQISPKLVYVNANTIEELLFRYVALHWSIPVSSGYGRRLRFLVFDQSNGKLIGLFGLCDPVYSIAKRDNYIGWSPIVKKDRLYNVMDAYVLGAVPPYSSLLCGKLIAMLTLSNEVREVFSKKYLGKKALISGKIRNPWLVLITTNSALGKSSIYNRIKINGFQYWYSLGFTQGSGEFHFSNGVYEKIRAFAALNCNATAKKSSWGKGFRNKREVIKKCLPKIGLSSELLYHRIQREIFIAPTAKNSLQYLKGKEDKPFFYNWTAEDLSLIFIERWLIPRAKRETFYHSFNRNNYRLWS